MKIKFSLYRYNSSTDWQPRYDVYSIRYSQGMTVLDVIMYIQKHIDPTLAYRYECRQGICGTCGLMLNGKPVLSCSTQIDSKLKKQTIEPLAHFPVEKDLIVNVAPILERFQKIQPFLVGAKKTVITRAKANESKPFRKCIECGCCIAGSSLAEVDQGTVIDPMSLVKIARYFTDPRDGLNRKKIAQDGGVRKYSIQEGKRLAKICPRGIPIDEAIKLLRNK